MKKIIFFVLFTFVSVTMYAGNKKWIERSEGSITFEVDENLPPVRIHQQGSLLTLQFKVDRKLPPVKRYQLIVNGKEFAKFIPTGETIPKEKLNILATSFEKDENITPLGDDSFFKCIVEAYANHQSLVLSPDMIWLAICQGFARYANANAEVLRQQLVSHVGKTELVIQTGQDLLSDNADWQEVVDSFATQISKHTKGNIAELMTCNFSTSGPVEKVSSQITLMESVKAYFDYKAVRIVCGIPKITLKGTPADWRQLLEKVKLLEQFGLQEWTKSLEPILIEFIRTSEGKPKKSFWQSMVKKKKVDELQGGGCDPRKPTNLDGWMLKLFPDENGHTCDSVPHNKKMPIDRMNISFKYVVYDPILKTIINENQIELWSGFMGADLNIETNTLTPKIGWMVRVADDE